MGERRRAKREKKKARKINCTGQHREELRGESSGRSKRNSETGRLSLTDKRNDRNRQKQSKRVRKRKRESGSRKKRCSPKVAWSRSCPINTGEQLDSLRPPS